MKSLLSLLLLTVPFLLLFSCGDSRITPDPVPDTDYYLIGKKTEGYSQWGSISKYSYQTNSVSPDVFNFSPQISNELFADATIHNGYMYTVRTRTGILNKVDLATKTTVAKWEPNPGLSTEERGVSHTKKISILNNQVAIAYSKILEEGTNPDYVSGAYLKFFDPGILEPTDSVFLDFDHKILDVLQVSNKIIVSLGNQRYYAGKILILDATSKQKVDEIESGLKCYQLNMASNSRVIALADNRLLSIDIQDFTITELTSLPAYADPNSYNRTAFYHTASNKLYYYALVPQPSPTPFTLATIDITTLEKEFLSGLSLHLGGSSMMVYDTEKQVIVLTHSDQSMQSKLSMLSLTAEIQQQVVLEEAAQKFIIK